MSRALLALACAAISSLVVAWSACTDTQNLGTGGGGGALGSSHSSASSAASGPSSGAGGARVGHLGARCIVPPDGGFGGGGAGGADAGNAGDAGASDDAGEDASAPLLDCGDGLTCLDSASNDPVFGGGPPGGFCTMACMTAADCAPLGGVCYTVDPAQPGRCTLACSIGPPVGDIDALLTPDAGELNGAKCLGRTDLRCVNTTANAGVCLPTCGDDADCNGLSCDPRSGVCTSTPSAGHPTGAACAADENPTPCAGRCVLFETGATMCSSPCVLGGIASPDGGPLDPIPDGCGGVDAGLCAFHPVTNGPGDTGYCTPSCALQSDCQAPEFFCFSVPEVTPWSNRGYCFAPVACPNGQSDCTGGPDLDAGADADASDASTSDAGDSGVDDASAPDGGPPDAGANDGGELDGGPDASAVGYVCTATPLGSFCLDPRFPLGSLPTDGGPGDAGDAGETTDDAGLDGG